MFEKHLDIKHRTLTIQAVKKNLLYKKFTPFVFVKQTHQDDIKVLKNHDKLKNKSNLNLGSADGIITNIKGVFLVIYTADCQAVLLYDYKNKIIGNVHSGWKGSIQNIIGKCVDKMINEFGACTKNIIAGIAPSLGPCCSEFINYKNEIPKVLLKYKIKKTPYFDFWKMSVDQLLNCGIKKKSIENMQICTKCRSDIFYSYRKNKTKKRFASIISLKQK